MHYILLFFAGLTMQLHSMDFVSNISMPTDVVDNDNQLIQLSFNNIPKDWLEIIVEYLLMYNASVVLPFSLVNKQCYTLINDPEKIKYYVQKGFDASTIGFKTYHTIGQDLIYNSRHVTHKNKIKTLLHSVYADINYAVQESILPKMNKRDTPLHIACLYAVPELV